ncbi:ribosomal protein S18 acetylase RimI-like enzyme [Aquimarina sp. MAR_2010_214]|uniref:GNAT family N-acetyltransferase n=1 Tax=Aquimarina sp. MAR_2010_214 TaxID=1250026 RepID=UPI000C70C007|nr:GNAT family N-acetyltransferase [Aquimarina sp. MAR_2010_214]PKV51347.1 ribosomal protein S18 acetylase RimI-like enzyme [Aquimarina sp. MAR_2010_214]
MIRIKKSKESDTEVLALLGRLTWAESHGHYIDDKNNLLKYLDENFSVSKTKQNIKNPKQHFYIIYADDLPIGYAKLIVNVIHENVASQNNCRLERIFILNDFIPLKIGKQLLTYVEEQAKALKLDTMWLSVYIKNNRAIRFYEKNEFKNVGELNFIVNGNSYENIVFSKKL